METQRVLIVFDLDGTLVDAFTDIQAAVNHALAANGLPTHGIEAIRGFVGNGLSRLCERAAGDVDRITVKRVEEMTRSYYSAHPADHARLYEGIKELLANLHGAGAMQAVLSNKSEELVKEILTRLGIAALLSEIRGERPGIPIKPDPQALVEMWKASGATRCLMVGDGMPDAECAKRAGAEFVGVTWGIHTREELEGYGVAVDTVAELGPLLLNAFPTPS